MPCRVDLSPEEEREISRRNDPIFQKTKSELDELTNTLCNFMKKLEREYDEKTFNEVTTPRLRKWWENHKNEDKKRSKQRG